MHGYGGSFRDFYIGFHTSKRRCFILLSSIVIELRRRPAVHLAYFLRGLLIKLHLADQRSIFSTLSIDPLG
jgi:hypothetical protein